jgi:hypothetical protein
LYDTEIRMFVRAGGPDAKCTPTPVFGRGHQASPPSLRFAALLLADTDLKQATRAFELRYWSALATVKYMEIRRFAKAALLFSRRQSPAGVRTRDG